MCYVDIVGVILAVVLLAFYMSGLDPPYDIM